MPIDGCLGKRQRWQVVGNVSLLVEHLPSMPKAPGLSELWPIISWFLWIFFFFAKGKREEKSPMLGWEQVSAARVSTVRQMPSLPWGTSIPTVTLYLTVGSLFLRWLAYGALQSHKCGVACANGHLTFKSLIFHSTVAMVTGIQSTDSPLIPLEDWWGLIFVLYGHVSLNDRDRLWKMCY